MPSFYSNGNKIKASEFKSKLSESPEDYNLYRKGSFNLGLGNILGATSGLILGDYFGGLFFGHENTLFGNSGGYNSTVFLSGVVGTIISVGLTVNGQSKMQNAIKNYNSKLLALKLDTTENGYGIVFTF